MNKQAYIIFAGIAVLVIGAVVLMLNQGSSDEQAVFQEYQKNQISDNNLESETDNNNQLSEDQPLGFSDRYLEYSEESLDRATANNGKAVIFFHADWCTNCRAAEADFQANFDTLPDDITILKADFDTESDLKQKYSIVMQDTFVQVDSKGNEITKWNGGGAGVNPLIANLQ